MRGPDVTLDVYLTPSGYQADGSNRDGITVWSSCRDFARDNDVEEMKADLLSRLRDTIEEFHRRWGRMQSGDEHQ